MDRFIYITPEQAKITHEKTIQYSGGGTLEELDFGKLESVLNITVRRSRQSGVARATCPD